MYLICSVIASLVPYDLKFKISNLNKENYFVEGCASASNAQ